MIRIDFIEGRYCPMLACDNCEMRLNAAEANAIWIMNARPPKRRVWIVHKGICHDSLDHDLRRRGGLTGWSDGARFLVDVLHNAGLHGDALNEALESSRHWSEIGL